MKKFLLILLILISSSIFAIDGSLRFGAIANTEKYNGEDEFGSYAPAGGFELTQSLFLFDVGGGIQYNGAVDGTDMETVPVYGLVKWNIIPIVIKPYIVAKAGKSIYSKDDISGEDPEAGNFYGVGAGITVRNLELEAFYSITEVDDTKRRDDELKQLSLMVGYKIF